MVGRGGIRLLMAVLWRLCWVVVLEAAGGRYTREEQPSIPRLDWANTSWRFVLINFEFRFT